MNDIVAILTSEDREEVKSRLKDLIITQAELDMEQLGVYLFDPDDVRQMIQEVYTDILEELKPQFKRAVKARMTELVGKMSLSDMGVQK